MISKGITKVIRIHPLRTMNVSSNCYYIQHFTLKVSFQKTNGLTDSQLTNIVTRRDRLLGWLTKSTTASVSSLANNTQLHTTFDLLRTNSSCAQTTDHGLNTSCYYSAYSAVNN